MTVISVDLAYKDYRSIGIAVLEPRAEGIDCEFATVPLTGEPRVQPLADYLVDLADGRRAGCLIIDGPQGWKHPVHEHCGTRQCERSLNTQGKTGLPGQAKPGSWLGFFQFSVDLFEELTRNGWELYAGNQSAIPPRLALESYPYAAWRGLELRPLPSKRRATHADIDARARTLSRGYEIAMSRDPNHDELQALVAGLGAVALQRETNDFTAAGAPPERVDGVWREGFIISPVRHPHLPELLLEGSESEPPVTPPRRPRPRRASRTTTPGYVNRNDQQVVRPTGLPGTDHGSWTYELRCRRCDYRYGSNGTDNWQRKCPRCQGGAPGNPLS
jgi:hypothetical protein